MNNNIVGSKTWLKHLVKVWEEFQEIDSDYTYHMQEGGDSKYTKKQWMNAWFKFDSMMKQAAKVEMDDNNEIKENEEEKTVSY